MDIKFVLVDVFMYLFEAWVFLLYAQLSFDSKTSYKKRIFLVSVGYTLLCLIYQTHNLIAVVISFALVNSLLLYNLFSINIQTACFHTCALIGIMASSEAITLIVSSLITDSPLKGNLQFEIYVTDIVISKLVYLIIALFIASIIAKRRQAIKETKPYWIMMILPVTDMFIMSIFKEIVLSVSLSKKMYILGGCAASLILISNIIVFIAFEISQQESLELSDLKTIQQQQETDRKYFEIIDQSNKEMQIFAHDIKNHMIQIRNMEDIAQVRQYIDSIYPTINVYSSIGISKNKILDLILSKYITLCGKNNLKFTVDAKTANLSYIEDADLSTLLNNLLDNAMEAAQTSKDHNIKITFSSRSYTYDSLVIENSCDTSPLSEGSKLMTTKKDKRLHGLGQKSIVKIVEKYNGIYDWKYDPQKLLFKTIIAFPKKKV